MVWVHGFGASGLGEASTRQGLASSIQIKAIPKCMPPKIHDIGCKTVLFTDEGHKAAQWETLVFHVTITTYGQPGPENSTGPTARPDARPTCMKSDLGDERTVAKRSSTTEANG